LPYVFLNERLVKEQEAKVSVNDHGFLYGDGVYETLRTFNGRVWQLKEHLKRLRMSASRLGIKVPWGNSQLEKFIVMTIAKNGFKESRVRLTITRGENDYNFMESKKPTLVIQVKELHEVDANLLQKGVNIVTLNLQRVLPEVKSISLLPMIIATRAARSKKAYECLFVDSKKYVTEGSVSNVFIVRKNVLITPKNGILPGTTRNFVLSLAKKRSITAVEKDFKLEELYGADEVFITNAPKGIVPVKKIDDINKGPIGVITKQIMESYYSHVTKFK
jgi:branched-chain amino acid aminotransferase